MSLPPTLRRSRPASRLPFANWIERASLLRTCITSTGSSSGNLMRLRDRGKAAVPGNQVWPWTLR